MNVSVRFARPDDAKQILQFIRELAAFQNHLDAVTLTADTVFAQLESGSPPFECLIAEQDGSAVGFAVFFKTYSTWTGQQGLYLEDLYVSPAARSGGVGKGLFLRLAEIVKERGYGRMDWFVANWNEQASRFYQTLGAQPLIEWTPWRLDQDGLNRLAPFAAIRHQLIPEL